MKTMSHDLLVQVAYTQNFKPEYLVEWKAPELFFRSEWNGGNFLTSCYSFQFPVSISQKQLREIELQMVSAISFGWFADFVKTLTIIQRSSGLF